MENKFLYTKESLMTCLGLHYPESLSLYVPSDNLVYTTDGPAAMFSYEELGLLLFQVTKDRVLRSHQRIDTALIQLGLTPSYEREATYETGNI